MKCHVHLGINKSLIVHTCTGAQIVDIIMFTEISYLSSSLECINVTINHPGSDEIDTFLVTTKTEISFIASVMAKSFKNSGCHTLLLHSCMT